MEQIPLIFSLIFFITFAIYLFFGIYTIHMDTKASLNRVFLALCVSLSLWSLGFSMANSAATLETYLFWNRVSAIGWGAIYGLLLHFLLLLTGISSSNKLWKSVPLLYLPAVISIYIYALSKELATAQYNLIKTDYGWITVLVQNGWTVFFNIYYLGYVLASLGIIWHWRRRASDQGVWRQANILFISIMTALLLGSLTDVILNAALKNPLPQMAPIFTLLPIAAIYYSMKHYRLMSEAVVPEDELLLNNETRTKLYFYISLAFLSGGVISALAYFLPHMVQSRESMQSMLLASGMFFALGLIILMSLSIKSKKIKKFIILTFMLTSIPAITLQFVTYASVTVWVFPLIMMIISLVFSTRIPLLLITAVSVATQMLVWVNKPEGAVQIDNFDYLVRINIFLLAFLVGSFVNKAYIRKLKESIFQINFQKLISETSFDFVSVNKENIDNKVNIMLGKIGRFFNLDRTYVFLINQRDNTMTYTHEWCNKGITPQIHAVQAVPLDDFPWWMNKLNSDKLVYIEDVANLPEIALAEKEQLTQQGVKSLVALSIEGNGKMLGFMGLDSVISLRKWTKYHFELLKILSNLLSDGLIKIESEKEIQRMAYYDHLTGLPNRTLFSDRLTQAIHLAHRSERYIAVIFIDLDGFKMVNDTMGHSGGDTLLKEVAQGLTQSMRKTDTVARFGGDEFVVMISDFAKYEDIIKVVENFMEMFKDPFTVHGQEFFITGSAGVAVYPFDGKDAETLVKNADIAMYIAKAKGRNRYSLCTVDMKEEVKKNIELSNSLYTVLDRDELDIYYQPQVRLSTGKIIGLEALLRWKHPEMGMILPEEFISLAETNGTINGIGEWVLKTAIRQNKKWQDMNFPHMRIAVNLSLVQLNNPKFIDNVARIMGETRMNPKYLELEITENVATKEAAHVLDSLNKLKLMGISISIDDFGTKYSSLNRLQTLPIDRIKIDMRFVQGIESNNKDRVITKVIINLAKSLGLEVLAEGVETSPQVEYLNQKLCDEVQGYYYYKPMPAEEIESLLRSGTR